MGPIYSLSGTFSDHLVKVYHVYNIYFCALPVANMYTIRYALWKDLKFASVVIEVADLVYKYKIAHIAVKTQNPVMKILILEAIVHFDRVGSYVCTSIQDKLSFL